MTIHVPRSPVHTPHGDEFGKRVEQLVNQGLTGGVVAFSVAARVECATVITVECLLTVDEAERLFGIIETKQPAEDSQ